MNLEIRDPFLLASVQPANIQSYLRSGGWQLTFVDEGVRSVWTLPGNAESFEVHVPLDADASGYAQRVHEVLQELSVIEERSQMRVFMDVQEWNSSPGTTQLPRIEGS